MSEGTPERDGPTHHVRLVEAILFASAEPVDEGALARRLPAGVDLAAVLAEVAALYQGRGVELAKVGKGWALRTAADLAPFMRVERTVQRKLSRAAIETLAIIAYHQPVTRAEIEEIRGVGSSKGTFEALLAAGFIRPRGRRQTPGRPVTWATTDLFLDHFQLEAIEALPGVDELKAAGLLDARPAIHAYGGGEDDEEDDDQPELDLDETDLEEALTGFEGEDDLPEPEEDADFDADDDDA